MKAGVVDHVPCRFSFPLALAVILGLLADENLPRVQLVFDDESW